MNTLNSQLQDVQRIMVQNIDDVLQRGTILSGKNVSLFITFFKNHFFLLNVSLMFLELDSKTQNLSMLSQKYRRDAAHLNSKSMYIKAVAGLVAFSVFILYFFIL